MSKRKFGFEGFGINRQSSYNFEQSQPPKQRLYVPPSSSSRHDNYEDHDLADIEYHDEDEDIADAVPQSSSAAVEEEEEIDPLDAFMEGIHEQVKAHPKPPKEKLDRYKDDEDDDHMESFFRAKKDVALTLASDVLQAGYDSDEEVYQAAKVVDAGLIQYDSDDNPVVILDKKKIEPIPPLDHSSIDYDPFNKDFYEESTSISVAGSTESPKLE